MYQGLCRLSELVSSIAVLLEEATHENDDDDIPAVENEDVQRAKMLAYDGIREARAVLPHLLQYASDVFEGSERSVVGPEVQEALPLQRCGATLRPSLVDKRVGTACTSLKSTQLVAP
jgi:hypothetical protein